MVAGVQEGAWPDVRRRGSLLEPDRLGRIGLSELPPTAARIAEERRLFYVACTRARHRLVVTAVAGTEGEGDQPSRFLAELGVPVRANPGRPRRPLTFAALVAELRRTATDPEAAPSLRDAAASRLARLADAVRCLRCRLGAGRGSEPLVGAGGADRVRPSSRRSGCAGPAVGQPAGRGPRLPAALVPRPEGPRRVGPQHGRDIRLGGPRAGRARRRRRRRCLAGRAVRPPRPGLGPARLRRQLAVGGRAGRGRVGAGTVRDLAGAADGSGAARHRGELRLRGASSGRNGCS